MAIYRIYPEKDSTIYTSNIYLNAGIDSVLELNSYTDNTVSPSVNEASRILIKFPTNQISSSLSSIVSGSFISYLNLYLADASKIPLDYTLYCYPISQSWDMGTGRSSNLPATTNGVSWLFTGASGSSNQWITSSFTPYVTASFPSNTLKGGGNWYTGSSTLNPISSQSFNYISNKDVNFNVTNAILLFYSSSLNNGGIYNNGFLIKKSDTDEFTSTTPYSLKYFSMDTHTIYPPNLEFKWNDSYYNTGSMSVVSNTDIVVTIDNNKFKYQEDSVEIFNINVRDKFPTRTFTTSSLYLNNKLLPSSSYWAIKDEKTGEFVIDFDTSYTKLSASGSNNYFKLYMNAFEPERFYKILIKSEINGESIVYDTNYNFKIVN